MVRNSQGTQVATDIAEAAERLGMNVATIELLLQQGLLNGYRDTDGRWKVMLQLDSGQPASLEHASAAPLHRHPSGSRSLPHPSRLDEARNPDLRRGLKLPALWQTEDGRTTGERVLAEQIEYLRERIDTCDRACQEKDALISELMSGLLELSNKALDRLPHHPAPHEPIDSIDARYDAGHSAERTGHSNRH
ncbi:MAG TPA: hypothetical protein VEU47_09135 [Candidatus Cybelea sp.]|nr:hypothetical protein [Candidatus Cybelea sp.]